MLVVLHCDNKSADVMSDSWAGNELERGETARRDGRLEDARADFAAASSWYKANGLFEMLVHSLTRQAQIARDLKDFDFAISYQQEALKLKRSLGEIGLAHTIRHLADILVAAGRSAEATPYYNEMEILYRASTDTTPLEMANAIRSIAVHVEALGDRREAQRLWQEARDRYSEIDHQFLEMTGEHRNPGVEEADKHLFSLGGNDGTGDKHAGHSDPDRAGGRGSGVL